jgi:hypothetical protein
VKKILTVLVAAVMVISLTVAAPLGAFTWDFTYDYGDGGYTSPYAAATVITFDSDLPAGWSIGGNYAIRTGSISDAAAPWWDNYNTPPGARDLTKYLTVPVNVSQSPQSATITFGASYNDYFGLWWGSMDTYNTFEFLAEDSTTVVATVLGTTFSSGSGAQDSSETNKYVNFYGLPNFYGVRITSTQYAFELDNIAVGQNINPVPIPAAVWLLGSGLLGLVGIRRRFKK